VNVARHSIAFFEDGGPLTLLGKLIESKCQHDLVGERLSQFYLLRPIRGTIDMANTDKASHVPSDQNGNGQKFFRTPTLQILTPLAFNTRISRHVVGNNRTASEKQFFDHRVLFPRQRVLDEWVLRIEHAQFSAV